VEKRESMKLCRKLLFTKMRPQHQGLRIAEAIRRAGSRGGVSEYEQFRAVGDDRALRDDQRPNAAKSADAAATQNVLLEEGGGGG